MFDQDTIAGTGYRTTRVTGGAGAEIFVEEYGDRSGRPVLFIHGLSQCGLSWSGQLQSRLGSRLRLVAMDLRGHGRSDRPDDYADSALWADDVHAVIDALELDRPILCGWSYGGVVIADYLSRYGEQAIGGINLVGAVSRLGEPALPYFGAEFVATLPGLCSTEVQTSMSALTTFLRLTTQAEPSPEVFYRALGYTSAVPPYVRQALLSRTLVHDDVLRRLTCPVLITHGIEDRIVLPAMAEYHARLMPHARTSYYAGVGHTPFREDPARFNAELEAFAAAV